MHEIKEENYYFLTIDANVMIDAGPKGNLARLVEGLFIRSIQIMMHVLILHDLI